MLKEFYGLKIGQISFPIPTDDLTRLIERDTSDFDPGADLSDYGPRVEGVTEFFSDQKPRVRIAAALAYDERRENRYRTTLTHEYGHVHLHAYLHQRGIAGSNNTNHVCKRDRILNASATDWLEWQAGHACGALLMPISPLRNLATDVARSHGLAVAIEFRGEARREMIETTKTVFAVSEEAARVRLTKLAIIAP